MLLRRIKRFVEENNLINKGDRVLVTLSAGLDSVVLLDVIQQLSQEWDLKIFVSHYNHRLRKNSVEDAKFVYRLCQERGLPLFITSANVAGYAKKEGLSLEMAGRELRYRLWYTLAKTYDFHKIILAHHLDDLAEEIFMRIIRGTGRRGLAGIPVKRENLIIRPLLFLAKEEIKQYALERKLTWREDPSNRDLRFLRNKVRHVLIPFLIKEFNPKIKEALRSTASIIAEEEELIEKLAWDSYVKVRYLSEGDLILRLSELKKLPKVIRRRIYFLSFQEVKLPLFRITAKQIAQIEGLLTGKAKGPVALPGNFLFYRGPGHLRLTKKTFTVPSFILEVSSPGLYELPVGQIIVETLPKELITKEVYGKNYLFFDATKLTFPFILRNRRPGDRVFTPGVGHKKLKKLLWEKKLPPYQRNQVIIVEKEGKIIAVWGIYVHPEFLPNETTKEVLLFRREDS